MVPGPQLRRIDERHVQEGQRARETHRLVSLRAQAAGVGLGGQRAVQALHTEPATGHHRRAAEGGGRPNGCLLRG
jgi:hypothetical protein